MVDRKPPRLVGGGERETLAALLRYQRESFVRTVTGVDDDAARRSPVGSGTSLLWLTKHLTRAETLWILVRFAGRGLDLPDDEVRDADTLAAAVDEYTATWDRVDATIAGSSLDDVCHDVGRESPVDLRWVLMHLLEETARHAGHADILRELVDGDTGR
jgi:hypothetical protein